MEDMVGKNKDLAGGKIRRNYKIWRGERQSGKVERET
jgi:hypothetical protein